MQTSEWVRLFTNAPLEAQDAIILGLKNGMTVAVQDFVRIDPEYVVLRGRLGGTTDSGQIFCLPYDQLTLFYLQRNLTDALLSQTFGGEITVKRDSLLDEDAPEKAALEDGSSADHATPLSEPTPTPVSQTDPVSKVSPDLRARLGIGMRNKQGSK